MTDIELNYYPLDLNNNITTTGGGSMLNLGNFQSPNYVPQTSGWKVDGTGNAEFQNITANTSSLVKDFTAGENLTIGNAVAVGDGLTYDSLIEQTAQDTQTAEENWFAQTFTTLGAWQTITKVKLWFSNSSSSPQNFTITLRTTSSGLPTNSDIANSSVTVNVGTGVPAVYTFTFTNPITLSPNTTYAIVINGLTYSGPTAMAVGYKNADAYSGGKMCKSTNSGATWAAFGTTDMYFSLSGQPTIAGYAYKTNASFSVANPLSNNFIGFATETKTSGSTTKVDIAGASGTLTGMSAGATYYLSNTPGAISSSAGTLSRKIGLALSATGLLIKFDNP